MTAEASPPPHGAVETRDLGAGRVVLAIGGLFAAVLVAVAAAGGLLALFERTRAPALRSGLAAQRQIPPAPRLETDTVADRAAFDAAAAARLSGYAWVDRAAGRARIPIERAMALTAARGWRETAGTPGGAP